jgi:hypothetical protein
MKTRMLWLVLAAAVLVVLPGTAHEGMWLFNNLPVDQLKKQDFEPTKKWLDHLQKASIRFNSGGSGSFIYPDGLVITNHHVGADALQKLGTKDRNILRDGFHARTRKEELKCEAMELNVLQEITDVTARVNKAVPDGTKAEEAVLLRRAAIIEIQEEAKKKTGLTPQVVTLYQGGAYHLYTYKKFTDVRLVFAPEQQIAFFGGDPDNFEFPRYDLDICIFRVYEGGKTDKEGKEIEPAKPVQVKEYLKWAKSAVKENDLVFVSGHPGTTQRLNTLAHLEHLRDLEYPFALRRLYTAEVLLSNWSERDEENARIARDDLFGVQNSRKAYKGMMAALLDPTMMNAKKKEEARLKAFAEKDDKLKDTLQAWDRIAEALKVRAKEHNRHTMIEGGRGFRGHLFGIARRLVRAGDERAKENKDRLPEYSEAQLESLTEELFSKEPIYPEYEILNLADSLTLMTAVLGHDNETVKKVLAGKSPEDRARELVKGSKLIDVDVRKKLYEGGKKAVDASEDPMILLAKAIDEEARAVRKIIESQVDEPLKKGYADIARVKFALDGTKTYPDATFTLRLSYGTVKGYTEKGKKVLYKTDFAGLFERSKQHKNKPPFDLPESWVKAKSKLDLKTPFNFVSTNDIIGGNSGSPVVNRDGEFVGIIFDGNIQSLAWRFVFDEKEARSTSVDAQGILEALRVVYDAGDLVKEITGEK